MAIQEVVIRKKHFSLCRLLCLIPGTVGSIFLFRLFVFSRSSCSHPFFQRFSANFATTVSVIHPLKDRFSVIRRVRLNYATNHHHPPPSTTNQNISTTTHHHPQSSTSTHYQPKYVHHHPAPPITIHHQQLPAKIYPPPPTTIQNISK